MHCAVTTSLGEGENRISKNNLQMQQGLSGTMLAHEKYDKCECRYCKSKVTASVIKLKEESIAAIVRVLDYQRTSKKKNKAITNSIRHSEVTTDTS